MSNKKKILFTSAGPILFGIVFLISSVNTCERFPELVLEITTDSIETLPGREYKLTGSIVSFGNEAITQHGFCWAETGNPTTSEDKTQLNTKDSKGSFTSTISDLPFSTKFYVRAYVETKAGTEYGNEKSFITPAPNLPSVTTIAISNVTETTAQSGGTVSDDGGATITLRGVCWSTSSNPTISDSCTTDGTDTGIFISLITGLDCNTTYYVRAYATNSVGTAYGDQKEFTISQCSEISLPTVTTTYLSNITTTSAEGGGEVTDDGGGTITAAGICWSTSQNPTISDLTTNDGTGVGSFTSNITGLTKSTTYHVRAYATNSAGTSYGDDIFLRTYEGTIFDYDGNEYWTVMIGSQKWMAENLNTTHYADGSAINLVSDNTEWSRLIINEKAYCWYDNIVQMDVGAIYTWSAATRGSNSSSTIPSGVQGICPTGWHLPSSGEWNILVEYLGGQDFAGGKLKETGIMYWFNPNTGATNESGFSARPGGGRTEEGVYSYGPVLASYWTTTATDSSLANHFVMHYDQLIANNWSSPKKYGWSIRCVEGQGYNVPTVTTASAINITDNSADAGGNVTEDGGQIVTEKGVCWSTDPNPTIDDEIISNGSGTGSFSSSITGLSPYTTYYIRAYGTNSVGTGYGEQDTIKTLWDNSKITDYDENVYSTIQIGEQVWMQENLKVTHYADGTSIPLVEDTAAWNALAYTDNAYCWNENNLSLGEIYGALYNWAAIMNDAESSDRNPSGVQGVCPDGWHIPSDEEWKILEMYLGMTRLEADTKGNRGAGVGSKLKEAGNIHWAGNSDATNESGFTALPAGHRYSDGLFGNVGSTTRFWTSSQSGPSDGAYNAWTRQLIYSNTDVGRYNNYKDRGFSIRCVKN